METLLDFLTKLYQSSKRYREKLDCPLSAFQQLYVCQACRSPGSSQDAIARRLCVSKSLSLIHISPGKEVHADGGVDLLLQNLVDLGVHLVKVGGAVADEVHFQLYLF